MEVFSSGKITEGVTRVSLAIKSGVVHSYETSKKDLNDIIGH